VHSEQALVQQGGQPGAGGVWVQPEAEAEAVSCRVGQLLFGYVECAQCDLELGLDVLVADGVRTV
jgi:hypothetical protein